jgi:hypothetical protein
MVDGGGGEYILICEGLCNPALGEVDAAVKAARVGAPGLPVGTDRIWVQQRRLAYTAHVETAGGAFFQCCSCGHVRRYGIS